jgi:hypothetical protein
MNDGSALYVATDLVSMEIEASELLLGLAQDLTQGDIDRMRAYRRLDLVWYRWLFHAMGRAKAQHERGKLNDAAWETYRSRFRRVWDWMRAHYTTEEIAHAEAYYCDARYLPPAIRDTRAYLALFQRECALV